MDVNANGEHDDTDSENGDREDATQTQAFELIDNNFAINNQCWGMLYCKGDSKQHYLYHRVQDGVKDRYSLGRHSSCDFQVSDKRISSKHCSIYCDYEESRLRVFLEDSSVNGTFVNDSLSRLHKNERIQLKSGDDIYLINPRSVCNDDGNKLAAFMFVNMRERLMAQRAVGLAPIITTDQPLVRHIEDDYVIGDEIGKGMSGVVCLCTNRITGLQCAVKIIDTKKFGLTPGLSPLELRDEAQIMKTLNHPNIIRIYDTYDMNHVIYIVMELVRGGDLFDSIVVKGKYTEIEAKGVMIQILAAVQYLHNNDIIHRDLKPENILLMSENVSMENGVNVDKNIRITDFGLAKRTTQEGLKTFCGTPQYFAPEVLKRRNSAAGAGRYGKAADMWSLGVILFILLSGTFPFDENALFDQISGAQYSMEGIEWYNISRGAKDLIRRLMTLLPHERLTIAQAMQHGWLVDNGPESSSFPTPTSSASAASIHLRQQKLDQFQSYNGSDMDIADGKRASNSIYSKTTDITKKPSKRKRSTKFVSGMSTMDSLFKERPVLQLEYRNAVTGDAGGGSGHKDSATPTSHPMHAAGINGITSRPSISSIFRAASKCPTALAIESSLRKSMFPSEEKENSVNRLVDFCTSYGFHEEISNISMAATGTGNSGHSLSVMSVPSVMDMSHPPVLTSPGILKKKVKLGNSPKKSSGVDKSKGSATAIANKKLSLTASVAMASSAAPGAEVGRKQATVDVPTIGLDNSLQRKYTQKTLDFTTNNSNGTLNNSIVTAAADTVVTGISTSTTNTTTGKMDEMNGQGNTGAGMRITEMAAPTQSFGLSSMKIHAGTGTGNPTSLSIQSHRGKGGVNNNKVRTKMKTIVEMFAK